MAHNRRGDHQPQDVAEKALPNAARTVTLAVLLTSLLWMAVAAALLLARAPQPTAFAVQPPPATWTPSATPSAVPATPTATARPAAAATIPTAPPQRSAEGLPAAPAALINLNTADATMLETLPGIGAVTAQAIVAYRTENGPFATLEALDQVKGIGAATLEKIRPLVTLADDQ